MTSAGLDGVMTGGRHLMTVRVHGEDTDFSGIVYHASYLRFLERGRTNWLRLLGIGQRELWRSEGLGGIDAAGQEGGGCALVVRAMTLDFCRSARLGDVVTVTTVPDVVKGASMWLAQTIGRGDTVMVAARVRIAATVGGQPRPLPQALRSALRRLTGA
ncbi:thioesterase family protein [Rhodoplanes serenus]|uniref:thioesterase family protein n=1 Tax=Rhodoplanes serenus TaxID=200615 RepID=UPI000DAC8EB2|nr:thioesterase family protein [Rhodoplanes serenus]RAI33153.1 hypothetical protein CH340_13160 [Rhodoplanes serenus]